MELSKNVSRKDNKIFFSNNGNQIPIIHLEKLMILYPEFIALLGHDDVKIVAANKQYFRLKFQNISLDVHSFSNLGIAYELFIEKLYDFSFPKDEYIVLDIGMNVGIASLIFANNAKMQHVYSYEPFLNTFEEAMNNISLNPTLMNKITPINAGVSNRQDSLNVPQVESGDASGSVTSFMIDENGKNRSTVKVEVRDLVKEIEQLKLQHAKNPFFLKIDCEGEKYNIIPHLLQSSVLENIDSMVIEWHQKGPNLLVDSLIKKGFSILHRPHLLANCGLLYAYKVQV